MEANEILCLTSVRCRVQWIAAKVFCGTQRNTNNLQVVARLDSHARIDRFLVRLGSTPSRRNVFKASTTLVISEWLLIPVVPRALPSCNMGNSSYTLRSIPVPSRFRTCTGNSVLFNTLETLFPDNQFLPIDAVSGKGILKDVMPPSCLFKVLSDYSASTLSYLPYSSRPLSFDVDTDRLVSQVPYLTCGSAADWKTRHH